MSETVEAIAARLRAEGRTPPVFCSFTCPFADNDRAQHAACLAVNGVWCLGLDRPVEKGTPCRFKPGP